MIVKTNSPKKYQQLKKKEKINWAFAQKIKRSFEDIKHGRVREWKD